jgi:hypothetical protein
MRGNQISVFGALEVLNRLDDYSLLVEEYMNLNFGRGGLVRDPYTEDFLIPNGRRSVRSRAYLVLDRKLWRQEVVVVVH